MDTYPGDLLAGVFPLVFAVDAILARPVEPTVQEQAPSLTEEQQEQDKEQEDGRPKSIMDDSPAPETPSKRHRTLFDRFLDAVAASLADEEDEGQLPERNKSDTLAALLAPGRNNADDTQTSSDDEDGSMQSSTSRRGISFRVPRVNNNNGSFRIKHTRLGVLRGDPAANQVEISSSTGYARALRMDGQGFFQQARILSVSTRHGFPPSKDPTGTLNRPNLLSQARTTMVGRARSFRVHTILRNQPINGILPSGWLEKHVHALPSVLIVVTSLSSNKQHQKKQDTQLIDTIEHLRISLAAKRDCRIHVVCITDNQGVSLLELDDWLLHMQTQCQLLPSAVSVLNTSQDLAGAESPGMPTSPAIRKLHRNVRDASLAYYLGEARRAKRKHAMLGHDQEPALLPLAVRYCFKIGIFYEFQLRHEKSTKYFSQAYRHLEHYFQFLQARSSPNPQGDDGLEARSAASSQHSAVPVTVEKGLSENGTDEDSAEEGVEVALASNSPDRDSDTSSVDDGAILSALDPPSDIAHQCRSVADWLNFKLLQAGFLSAAFSASDTGANGGLVAASSQWRRHCQTFLSKSEDTNPSWNHWSFLAHQRLVMAQLVERNPPSESMTTGLSGAMHDEVLHRCSPWRSFVSAAEAQLRLAVYIENQKEQIANNGDISAEGIDEKSMRPKFVGSIDSEGLEPLFQKEAAINHKELALDMTLHAVSLFESDIQSVVSDTPNSEGSTEGEKVYRAASRLYYLAGGILCGMKRHKEATPHLEKALRYSLGWNELELAIRRMLIECYENNMPETSESTTEQTKVVASMILDSYFNTELSSHDLRRALDNFSSLTGNGVLKWNHECADEADSSLPFWFTVTFPEATHATTGDVVKASVAIKSNLDYAVHVNLVTLLSMAGPIKVPPTDLLRAKNADEGDDGGIIIQAQSTIFISTLIDVPKDLSAIASDESGNGGEAQGTPGKGSFAKSARPRTGGMTAAGGARIISEQGDNRQERTAQWSTRCLGGKPLRCDGMSLTFTPVHVEKAAAVGAISRANMIEVTIVHKKPKTQAPIKRTPFEEDNYIASAWSRPPHLPLELGPRCMRVLGPMPQMVVTNLTDPATRGKVLEGTVNRILLKLEAGPKEECHDIKYRINCSTTLLSIDGSTTNLNMDSSEYPNELSERKQLRTPVLVTSDDGADAAKPSGIECELPGGWKLVGSGQGSHSEVTPEKSNLNSGSSSYIYFDLYRPSAELDHENTGICQTDFDVSITYKQSRPFNQAKGMRKQGSVHTTSGDGNEERDIYDKVFLEHSGSVVWIPPLSAEFTPGVKKDFPSGSSHPSNLCPVGDEQKDKDQTDTASVSHSSEIALVDGERITTRCTFKSDGAKDGLSTEISKVWFEECNHESKDTDSGHNIKLVSEDNGKSLYEPAFGDVCAKLCTGTKFALCYTSEAKLNGRERGTSTPDHLGVLCVRWLPVGIPEVTTEVEGHCIVHGPIALKDASVIKFRGPPCMIENAPFETILDSLPPSPQLAVPFEVIYRITNKTSLHQKLQVVMNESTEDNGKGDIASEGLLVSGLVNGEVCVAPFETQRLIYTALATKAGKTVIPAISVSSSRYKTWLINNNSNEVFVLP